MNAPIAVTLSSDPVLVCFAVKEETAAFRKRAPAFKNVSILVSGMGKANAERAVNIALTNRRPALVLTCGFAGGLNPSLRTGDVVFESDAAFAFAFAARLRAAGAAQAKFHCAGRVATTREEKALLRESTGADAVEMESSIIRARCHERGIPCATVRVISDAANENLPLDFNRLMTADHKISPARLAAVLMRNPGTIPKLIRLQRNTAFAASRLSEVLTAFLGAGSSS